MFDDKYTGSFADQKGGGMVIDDDIAPKTTKNITLDRLQPIPVVDSYIENEKRVFKELDLYRRNLENKH
jgi:hypothetical protein